MYGSTGYTATGRQSEVWKCLLSTIHSPWMTLLVNGSVKETRALHSPNRKLNLKGNTVYTQGFEAEFGTSWGKRLDDTGDVVTDETEASRFGLLLHSASKGGLCCIGHGVSLIQNDDLVWRTRPTTGRLILGLIINKTIVLNHCMCIWLQWTTKIFEVVI